MFRAGACDIALWQFAEIFVPIFGILTWIAESVATKYGQTQGRSYQYQQK
jgi:hypothetical protein